MKCFAKFCTNKTTPGFKNIGFFRFPGDEDLQSVWKKFCGVSDNFEITACSRVCSFHFAPEDVYFASSKGKIMKRRMAIPVYEFVPQIADFALENDDIPDLNSTLETSGTTLNSNASSQNVVPVFCSPYDEHKAVCASTKRKYDGYLFIKTEASIFYS
ncbi:AAEL011614-PA [Aedes aegypti]|uniref:AAEL011614-PA n=1 Tax=Aedes aegypti TaxID=7159 RepID=Q16PJ2_AEDAE|nr:AAEL011614-PA [Aedes aegypti]